MPPNWFPRFLATATTAWRRSASRSRGPFSKLKYSEVIPEHLCIASPGIFSKEITLLESCRKASKHMDRDSSGISWLATKTCSDDNKGDRKFHSSRCLTFLENSQGLLTIDDLLPYIKSTFFELEGSNHCWFNRNAGNVPPFEDKGIFLVLVGAFLHDPASVCRRKQIILLERIKMLQKVYPNLQIFGFQHCKSISSMHSQSLVAMTVAEEYAQFPVLLSDKDFYKGIEFPNECCYLLFRGSENEVLKYNADMDVRVISAEIDKYNSLVASSSDDVKETQIDGVRDFEVSKGFYSCSFKNMLLNYPGCVSADEHGGRLFISDTNHHRIIVSNGQGKIRDCIGSFPGHADGGFESAQLLRPAGSVYHADEDCLYFVDCENHSIRKAHLASRVVDTLYPVYSHKGSGIWHWIMNKLNFTRENDQDLEGFNLDSFAFPWHLMRSGEDDLLVLTRSLETSWLLSMQTGQIKSVIKGFSNIAEAYKKIITEKASLVKEVCRNLVLSMINPDSSLDMFPYQYMISAATEFKREIVYCDAAAQRVLKCDPASGKVTHINFSDLEILGLPYWIVNTVETVLPRDTEQAYWMDHIQNFDILPGRCNILVRVDISNGFELEAPLQEECIWREARGSATEITGIEDVEKVGAAQQWYDDLDNLFYSKLNPQSCFEFEEANSDSMPLDEKKVLIKCAANTSPGTSEIVIVAALYLKLQTKDSNLELKSKLQNLYRQPATYGCIELLLESIKDSRGLIFVKPLHVRIKLNCAAHPTDPLTREIISTTTNLQVDVCL